MTALYVLPPVDDALETINAHCVVRVRTIICRLKNQVDLRLLVVLITHVTRRGKASAM